MTIMKDTEEVQERVTSESDESETDNEDVNTANVGWVDSISKILKTRKPKGKKTLILAKAKKLTDVQRIGTKKPADLSFQIDGEVKEDKSELELLLDKQEPNYEPPKKKKKDLPKLRVKPNILEKDRERTLSKIATRGVVQLFNAVKSQQKVISKQLDEAGPLERKREKVLKSIDKRTFLDVLMGEKSETVKNTLSNHPILENKTWNVLRDDFMMGAELKDWDKELEDEEERENENEKDKELEEESDLE